MTAVRAFPGRFSSNVHIRKLRLNSDFATAPLGSIPPGKSTKPGNGGDAVTTRASAPVPSTNAWSSVSNRGFPVGPVSRRTT